jgi:hypothetical protein
VNSPTSAGTFRPDLQRRTGWFDRIAASPVSSGLALLVAAVLFRAIQFGNPVVQPDDQFYLLTGDRLLQGVLPYVDIWDRKPVGLFILYAGIRLLPGDGVLAYQLVATAFAAATAFVIRQIALRFASPPAALSAALVYLVYLGVFGGEAGQSPVFYNLLMAAAALLLVRIIERPGFGGRAVAFGAAAMALVGLSIQIKYPALFEGLFFGLSLMWLAHRRGWTPGAIALAALGWATIAVAPTLAAWGWYEAMGHGEAFVYANFVSIFERGSPGRMVVLGRLLDMVLQALPLGIAAWFSWRARYREEASPVASAIYVFCGCWSLAAIGAILAFGSFYDHYALPMLVPLAIVAAPILGDRRAGIDLVAAGRRHHLPLAAFVVIFATALSVKHISKHIESRGRGIAIASEVAFLKPRLKDCLFVYASEPILYHLTGSCLPGRWPFPDHLNNGVENASIGIDPLVETRRIMANRPEFVASIPRPFSKMNMRTWTFMQGELARDYRLVWEHKVGKSARQLYQRRPGI